MEALMKPITGLIGLLIALAVILAIVHDPATIINIAKGFGTAIYSAFFGGGAV